MKRYILTGTPGCGKTSIIKELEKFGFNTVAEAATDIIALNKAKDITEPWKIKDFIDDIITLQKHRQQEISDNKIDLQFFDRSPICTYALAIYLKFIPSDNLMHEIKRILNHNIYEKTVFFVDNLGYIKNTEARKISFEESIEFEKIHFDAYKKFGFDCIHIPIGTVNDRAKFILECTQVT